MMMKVRVMRSNKLPIIALPIISGLIAAAVFIILSIFGIDFGRNTGMLVGCAAGIIVIYMLAANKKNNT